MSAFVIADELDFYSSLFGTVSTSSSVRAPKPKGLTRSTRQAKIELPPPRPVIESVPREEDMERWDGLA